MENLTPQELNSLMKTKAVKLVDVRKDHEVAHGVIEGAMHIPMNQVNGWLSQQELASPFVFYCHIGVRSGQAGLLAESLGFKNIYNLVGGVVAWHQAKYEFIKI